MPNTRSLSTADITYIENVVFAGQTIQDTSNVLDGIFFDYLSSHGADETDLRNDAIVSYRCLKRLLVFISANKPESNVSVSLATLRV